MPKGHRSMPVEYRFWDKVKKTESCWLWIGAINNNYGCFNKGNRNMIKAHRFSWELAYGEIPKDKFVLHKCDTPRCVNPEHLFLGTHYDNYHDAVSKKRRLDKWGYANEANFNRWKQAHNT